MIRVLVGGAGDCRCRGTDVLLNIIDRGQGAHFSPLCCSLVEDEGIIHILSLFCPVSGQPTEIGILVIGAGNCCRRGPNILPDPTGYG